jgi:hypothetical protein
MPIIIEKTRKKGAFFIKNTLYDRNAFFCRPDHFRIVLVCHLLTKWIWPQKKSRSWTAVRAGRVSLLDQREQANEKESGGR